MLGYFFILSPVILSRKASIAKILEQDKQRMAIYDR